MLERAKSGGVRLLRYGKVSLPIEHISEADRNPMMTAAVKELLREQGVRGGRAVISVSGQSVFTRFVKLPAATPENIERMVGFEAQQNVPFPMTEVVWDYQLIGGSAEKGEFDVVLVAIKSDIIEGLARAVGAAGVRVDLVDVSSLALYNAVRYNYDIDRGCHLVVDIGARTTNLIFLEREKIFTRAVAIGGNHVTQEIMREFDEEKMSFAQADALKCSKGFVGLGGAYAEPDDPFVARVSKVIRNVMTRIHAEVTRSVIFYRTQQGGQAPTKMLLAGGSASLPYLDYFFKEKLQAEVEFFNPFRNIELGPSTDRDLLGRQAPGYGGAVGLALRLTAVECPIEVNLLPRFIAAQREFNKKKKYFAGCAVGLALIGAGWWGHLDQSAKADHAAVEKLQTRVQNLQRLERQIQDRVKAIGALEKDKEQIKQLAQTRARWSQLLNALAECLPTDTWIVQLQPASPPPPPSEPGAAPAEATPVEPPPEPPPEPLPGEEGQPRAVTGAQITELVMDCASIYTPDEPERLQKQTEFLRKLHENTALFDANGTVISKGTTSPKEGDFCVTFKITAKLKEPIPQ